MKFHILRSPYIRGCIYQLENTCPCHSNQWLIREDGDYYRWKYDEGADFEGQYEEDEYRKEHQKTDLLRGYSKVILLRKRGLDAGIYQAQLNLQIARQDERKIRDDLRYSVTGLLSEVKANQLSLTAHQKRLVSEEKKVNEALERYRVGREATDRLIQFENEMQVAKLALDQDRIALERRLTNLSILLGRIWQAVDYDKGP